MPATATIPRKKVRRRNPMVVPHVNNGPEGRMATEEEIEMFRRAEEEFARGEYYSMLPDETAEEFFNRISADPQKWLECNMRKEREAL